MIYGPEYQAFIGSTGSVWYVTPDRHWTAIGRTGSTQMALKLNVSTLFIGSFGDGKVRLLAMFESQSIWQIEPHGGHWRQRGGQSHFSRWS